MFFKSSKSAKKNETLLKMVTLLRFSTFFGIIIQLDLGEKMNVTFLDQKVF